MAPNPYESPPTLHMNVPMDGSGYLNAPMDGSGYLNAATDGIGYLNVPMAGEVIVCWMARDADDDDDDDNDDLIGDERTTSDISGISGISCGSSEIKSGSESRQSVHSFNEASMEDIAEDKDVLMFSHPFNTVKKTVTKLGRLKYVNLEVDKVQLGDCIREFLAKARDLPWCYNKRKWYFVKCNCNKKLQGGKQAVSFLSSVGCITKSEQDALYKELFNGSHHQSGGYNISIGDDKDSGYSLLFCLNTFLNVLSIGRKRHTKLLETRLVQGSNINKNVVNTHAVLSSDVTESVVRFIKDKGREEGEVYATHIIRSLTGHELRDEEKGAVDLPSNTSRREMYENYCLDCGWTPKSDNKGRYPKVSEYPKLKNDDMLWETGVEVLGVCSWWSFRELWKKHCPTIRIRRS
jgi:hypothetical protein